MKKATVVIGVVLAAAILGFGIRHWLKKAIAQS